MGEEAQRPSFSLGRRCREAADEGGRRGFGDYSGTPGFPPLPAHARHPLPMGEGVFFLPPLAGEVDRSSASGRRGRPPEGAWTSPGANTAARCAAPPPPRKLGTSPARRGRKTYPHPQPAAPYSPSPQHHSRPGPVRSGVLGERSVLEGRADLRHQKDGYQGVQECRGLAPVPPGLEYPLRGGRKSSRAGHRWVSPQLLKRRRQPVSRTPHTASVDTRGAFRPARCGQ